MRIITLSIFLIVSNVISQEAKQRIEFEKDQIHFVAEIPDGTVSYGDTVMVQYTVLNRSKDDVYVFAVANKSFEINREVTVFRLGSAWVYRPGHSFGGLRKVKSKSTYSVTIPCIIKEPITFKEFSPNVEDLAVYGGVKEVRKLMFISCVFESAEKIKLVSSGLEKGDLTFEKEEDGYLFESNLFRFVIGALEIKVK